MEIILIRGNEYLTETFIDKLNIINPTIITENNSLTEVPVLAQSAI